MRTIKFRGYNRKNNEWLHGFYLQNRGWHFVCPDEFATNKSWDDYQVDPETVGQFTGLLDKNGKEIYEGDILESNSIRHVVKYLEKGALFAGVSTVIKDAMTGDYAETPLFQHWIDGWKKEVIGNIHDNPELISK